MCLCVSNKVNVENKNAVITRDQPLVHSYTYSETKHDTNMFIFCCQKQTIRKKSMAAGHRA